jgi:hypothetical protein
VHDGGPGSRVRRQHDIVPNQIDEFGRLVGTQPGTNFGGRHALQRLLLPMHELRFIESSRGTAKMLGPEMCGHVGGSEPPVHVAGVSQMKQMIEDRGTQKASLAKFMHAGAAMALGQWGPVRTHQQSHVPVARASQLQRIEQHELARGIGEMIVAAQHMSHAHSRIIDGVAEKEGRRAVRASDDEITDNARREFLRPVDQVDEFNRGVVRYRKPQGWPKPACLPVRPFCRREIAARPGVARRLARHLLQLAGQLEILRRAIARVRQLAGLQPGEQGSIICASLGLRIGRGWPADIRSLVPVEPEPTEIDHELIAKSR